MWVNEMWTAIATVIAAVVSALAGSGLIGYFQNKHKTTAETRGIEQNIISKIRGEGDKKNAILIAHAELYEYKFDMLLEEYFRVIDQLRDCPSAPVEDLRRKAFEIKYTDRIPGRLPPPQFPNSPSEPT